jgi:hypothetical protein
MDFCQDLFLSEDPILAALLAIEDGPPEGHTEGHPEGKLSEEGIQELLKDPPCPTLGKMLGVSADAAEISGLLETDGPELEPGSWKALNEKIKEDRLKRKKELEDERAQKLANKLLCTPKKKADPKKKAKNAAALKGAPKEGKAKNAAALKGAPKDGKAKKAAVVKGAPKEGKAKKRKAPDDEAKKAPLDWKTFLKNQHSKVWHKEKKYCLKQLGLDEKEAKIRAKEAAKKALDEFMQQKLDGTFDPQLLVCP